MECEPSEQLTESIWRNYANTLEKDLAGKLNKDIGTTKVATSIISKTS